MAYLIAQIFLIVLASIFSAIAEIREGLSKEKKKNLRWISLSILFTSLLFSMGLVIYENYNSAEDLKEQERRYNIADSKLTRTAKSLETIHRSANTILDSMEKQLIMQKEITKSSQTLLLKSQLILNSQKNLTDNVDKIINPFFPLLIKIGVEIPFNNQHMQPLVSYVNNLKTKYDQAPKIKNDWFQMPAISDQRVYFDDAKAVFELHKLDLSLFNTDPEITFIDDIESLIGRGNAKLSFRFHLPAYGKNKSRYTLSADLSKKVFLIEISHYELSSIYIDSSDFNISHSTLNGLHLMLYLRSKYDLKMSYIYMSPNEGISKSINISPGKQTQTHIDGRMMNYNAGKIFVHTMSAKEVDLR